MIIVAPHPDDELIGCYNVIKRYMERKATYELLVYYVTDGVEFRKESAVRLAEARKFAEEIGLYPVFVTFHGLREELAVTSDLVLVPDVTESHPDHRRAAYIARSLTDNVVYYSTEMSGDHIMEVVDWREKRAMLDRYYPSQRSLWESDWKYFLFEGYRPATSTFVLDAMFGRWK